ncbi:autotransporter serine protease [Bordetella bronchialis]
MSSVHSKIENGRTGKGLRQRPRRRSPAYRGVLAGCLCVPVLAYGQVGPATLLDPAQFRTDEYRASWALEAIHAADAYALGYSGKGVRVGVVDDGDILAHQEFAGRIVGWSPDGPRRAAYYGMVGEHSTEVSGVLAASKDGRGMHGVAYGADLVPILLISEDGFQTPQAIRDAVDRGAQVINGSYGLPVFPYPPRGDIEGPWAHGDQSLQTFALKGETGTLQVLGKEAEALRYAAAHDAVMVYSAGNDNIMHPKAAVNPSSSALLPYIRPENHDSGVYQFVDGDFGEYLDLDPSAYIQVERDDSRLQEIDFSDLEQSMIAVVALGPDGRIASYSNRCGVAWRWCIAAPGGDLPHRGQTWGQSGMYTATPDGYASDGMVGTSYAAPMVAGSLAVLKEAFPYMRMTQLREILLTSADRRAHLGEKGVYGWGEVDLGRAVRGPVEFGADGFAPIFDVDTQGHDSWWGNDISGVGGMTKRGAGLLLMTGDNRYTGPTTVKGGTLAVYGSNALSRLTIERDGTLTGSGTVGPTEVSGTVAPGNPGAPLRVAGAYVQHAGSTYVAGVGDDGEAADAIQVQGQARIENAALRLDGLGPKAVNREYTVLQADGGISGGYARLADPYVFLDLRQGVRADDPTRYRVALQRNGTGFDTAADSANQRAVAQALDTAGVGLAPYDATVMATRTDGLAAAFDRWSGEAHASTLSVLSTQAAELRDGMLGRARAMGDGGGAPGGSSSQAVVRDDSGKAAWARYAGSRDRLSGNGNAASVDATRSGLLIGGDMPLSGGRVGLMAGFSNGGIKVRERGSSAKVDSHTLGAYGNTGTDGAVRVRYGAAYSWHAISSKRDTGLDRAEARYKAGTAQVFAEAGLPQAFGDTTIEPYAGLAYADTRRRAFQESGDAGLRADAARQRLGTSTLGLRGDTGWDLKDGARLALHGGAGWRHAYGTLTPVARMRFAQGQGYDVHGTPVARDAMLLEAGATLASARGMRLSAGYSGQLARGMQSHAVQANATWRF